MRSEFIARTGFGAAIRLPFLSLEPAVSSLQGSETPVAFDRYSQFRFNFVQRWVLMNRLLLADGAGLPRRNFDWNIQLIL
jgi:hypothetical protein